MKKQFNLLIAILAMLTTNYADAQILGRSSNSQNPGKEVSAQGITSGSVSNDVNLFTGTLNSSYTLGTVKTLSGLSFTASLSYGSVFSSGDNMPHLSGGAVRRRLEPRRADDQHQHRGLQQIYRTEPSQYGQRQWCW